MSETYVRLVIKLDGKYTEDELRKILHISADNVEAYILEIEDMVVKK